MNSLTLFGACAVAIMLLSYALEQRSPWLVLIFALAYAASSLYGWLAGSWPFGGVGVGSPPSLVGAPDATTRTDVTVVRSLALMMR